MKMNPTNIPEIDPFNLLSDHTILRICADHFGARKHPKSKKEVTERRSFKRLEMEVLSVVTNEFRDPNAIFDVQAKLMAGEGKEIPVNSCDDRSLSVVAIPTTIGWYIFEMVACELATTDQGRTTSVDF